MARPTSRLQRFIFTQRVRLALAIIPSQAGQLFYALLADEIERKELAAADQRCDDGDCLCNVPIMPTPPLPGSSNWVPPRANLTEPTDAEWMEAIK